MSIEATKWNGLIVWLKKNGMQVDELAVELRDFKGSGRGLAVTKEVQPNEVLFTIPKSCLLNADSLKRWSPARSARHLTSTQLLTAFLATYKCRSSDEERGKFFSPYLDMLPEDFGFHPLTWVLQGNDADRVARLPARARFRLERTKERFRVDLRAVQDLFPALAIEDCLWGWLNVNTRSLYYKCETVTSHADHITLCPLLDFANHSFVATNFNSAKYRRLGHPIPTMIAPIQGLSAGQQVYLFYGHHSNEVLFIEYGFTDVEAPRDICIDKEVMRLFSDNDEGRRKKELLESKGYWGDWFLHNEPTPAQPSYRIIPALRILHISLGEEHLTRQWEDMVNGIVREISPANSALAWGTLASICERLHSEAASNPNVDVLDHAQGIPDPMRHLWEEQRDVSRLVLESISSGIEL